MSCYCDTDYEAPTFYRKTVPTARIKHRCEECGAMIRPGEKYESVSGMWDGDFGTFKTCQHCIGLREYVKAHVPCLCWAHGNIVDDCIEAARNYAHDAPGLLFGAYRFVVRSRRARASATILEGA